MKRIFFGGAICAVLLCASCTKDVAKMSDIRKKRLVTDDWKVSSYNDKGTDKTAQFSGYVFSFEKDGLLNVNIPAKGNVTGTWDFYSNDLDDNHNTQIIIKISGTAELDDVNDTWVITKLDRDHFELDDFDSSNGNEQLHFVKN